MIHLLPFRHARLAVLGVILSGSASAWAQITPLGGVYIDAGGVLRAKEEVDSQLEKPPGDAAAKDSQLIYISLPRIFAEAERLQRAGKPIPDEIRYLGGMVKLQYVFVYPDKKDIVIAGRAEPFEKDASVPPRGKLTGRPVLHLDDLVTALRACGPGGGAAALGCDLEITREGADRVQRKTKELAPKIAQIGERRAAKLIAEAGGAQPINYLGVGDDNRFAVACAVADYQIKLLTLGLWKSPVKSVRSYDMSGPPQPPHRFAFECAYDALAVSPDGNAFELRGPSLKIVTSLYSVDDRNVPKEGKASPAARKFADQCSKHMEDLCRHLPAFADLANLADLSVLAALIGRHDLHRRIDWDLAWILDRQGYARAVLSAPKFAQMLCAYRRHIQQTIFVTGGVLLVPGAALQNVTKDEKGILKEKARRPEGTDWSATPPLR
ncbi:MAG: DUF1598 domain-containing protein [Planctomycetes bacterium]|nr:DUF1598 domain-containing protein [Planctomycetota bacterium]